MYTLKSMVHRTTAFGSVFALAAAVVVPSGLVFADALNPLTERSLLLSSSAPGYQDTDGSGNSNAAPNAIGQNYAPAGSGPNGKKSGETFTFKTSSDSTTNPIKAFTLQYCTKAAGLCQAPGDNTGDARTTRQANEGAGGGWVSNKSDFDVTGAWTQGSAPGQFEVFVNGAASPDADDWTMTLSNQEDNAHSGALTGKKNFMTLASPTGEGIGSGDTVKIVFTPSESVFITNPGSGSFFVKMNTFSDTAATTYVDGGVTVANVMTDSIHITTKVLETMSFSVGTRNRDTVDLTSPVEHGTCDPIQQVNNNQLQLGNPDAEYSLETDTSWDVKSYWRLSSNSSGGASVYYSGDTLANTVGDQIAPIGPTAATSTQGTEQFGLGFVDATNDDAGTFDQDFLDSITAEPARFKTPKLDVLTPELAYANATGSIQNGQASPATFAFVEESNTVPELIAENDDTVISCDTAKMRYVANIGADTPAGVYTTKINYLAAPQY